MLSKDISNYKINIDIKSNQIKQNIIEVLTSINLKPTKDDFEKINTKIVYATIVELSDSNVNKDEIEKIVLIKILPKFIVNLEQYLFRYLKTLDLKILK